MEGNKRGREKAPAFIHLERKDWNKKIPQSAPYRKEHKVAGTPNRAISALDREISVTAEKNIGLLRKKRKFESGEDGCYGVLDFDFLASQSPSI